MSTKDGKVSRAHLGQRLSTGIKGLDEILGGGFPANVDVQGAAIWHFQDINGQIQRYLLVLLVTAVIVGGGGHGLAAAYYLAKDYGISRDEADAFAVRSHRNAAAAWDAGKFDAQLVPIEVPQRKGDPIAFDRDDEGSFFRRFGINEEKAVARAESHTLNAWYLETTRPSST
mgnify:CR=1 FL=1